MAVDLRSFLEEVGLEQYAAQLQEAGYDSLDGLRDMAGTAGFVTDMGEDVGMLIGHARRLQAELLEGAGSVPLCGSGDSVPRRCASTNGGLVHLASTTRQEVQEHLTALDSSTGVAAPSRGGVARSSRLLLGAILFVAAISWLASLRALHASPGAVQSVFDAGASGAGKSLEFLAPLIAGAGLNTGGGALPADVIVQRQFAQMDFNDIWPLVSPWTIMQQHRVRFVYEAVTRLNQQGLEGDLVECGVWKGGLAMAMVFSNMRSLNKRHVWLYDTFEGVPEPSAKDDKQARDMWGKARSGQRIVKAGIVRGDQGRWDYGPLEVVSNNMQYTNYPRERVHIVRGDIEETLRAGPLPQKVAVLHLHTHLYASTLAELEVLYDRLVPGGILFLDDFCVFGGANKAATEFFTLRGLQDVLKMRRDQERDGQCLYLHKA